MAPFIKGPFLLERATGIEPALSAWEADVMPFHYARIISFIVIPTSLRFSR